VRVFLLEDEYSLRVSIEEFLEDLGFEVEAFERGDEFFDAFFNDQCDLLLLDVKVPGIDGFELLKEIRKEGKNTPAIFITSMSHVNDMAKGFEIGCCDYIKKPFDLKELEVRMQNVLKRECFGSNSHTISLPGGCEYDLKKFTLKKQDREISLTKQEKRILELLVKHRGSVVTPAQFCDEIWGEYVDLANVRVQINKLRKKVGKDVIKNIHGLGYRIDT